MCENAPLTVSNAVKRGLLTEAKQTAADPGNQG